MRAPMGSRMTDQQPLERPACQHLEPLVLTENEVAALLRLPRDQVRLARVNGLLPYRQLGDTTRSIRYTPDDIEVFLANQARGGIASSSEDRTARLLPAPRNRARSV